MYIYRKKQYNKIIKRKQRTDRKGENNMKYYKIYSNACVSARPVQEVTHKKDEVLNEAIEYQYDGFFNSNGTTINDEEVKKLYEATKEDDVDDQIFNTLYEKIADILVKDFEESGRIAAGDWGLVALDDDEDAWAYRPNRW